MRHIRCGHGFAVLLAYQFVVRSIMVGSGQPFHLLALAVLGGVDVLVNNAGIGTRTAGGHWTR
jgi:NAD(P)-dependent dehydrogenase (short-subunit alcohol dehydrogenase family)